MYTSGAKQYWIAWPVKHEKKRELQVSVTPKKGPHAHSAFSEIQISPKEEMEVNSLFLHVQMYTS